MWHRGPRRGEVRCRGHWSPHGVEDPHPENIMRDVAQFVLQNSPSFWEEVGWAAQRGGRVEGT